LLLNKESLSFKPLDVKVGANARVAKPKNADESIGESRRRKNLLYISSKIIYKQD
jgi:hypothetical protein